MRGWQCVPMILLLILSGCAKTGEKTGLGEQFREPYQKMEECRMEAVVSNGTGSPLKESFQLSCTYRADGTSSVEILAPEEVQGVQATFDQEGMSLIYEGQCLNTGTISREELSPAACLPCLMDALQNGWLLEKNREKWMDTECVRLSLDRSGENGGKLVSTLWLREEDGKPLYGEIAVEDKIILCAEFTKFEFGDILKN